MTLPVEGLFSLFHRCSQPLEEDNYFELWPCRRVEVVQCLYVYIYIYIRIRYINIHPTPSYFNPPTTPSVLHRIKFGLSPHHYSRSAGSRMAKRQRHAMVCHHKHLGFLIGAGRWSPDLAILSQLTRSSSCIQSCTVMTGVTLSSL